MDAPTTTSADNGSSGGNSGDWGWFTPSAKKSSGEPQERQNSQDRQQGQDGQAETDERGAPHDRGEYRDRHERQERAERNDREHIPSRPVNPIRPVGTAAERERETEPPQAAQSRPGEAARQHAAPSSTEYPAATAHPGQSTAAPGYTASAYTTPRHEAEPTPSPHADPFQGSWPVWERVSAPEPEPEPVHESARATQAQAAADSAPTGAAPVQEPAVRTPATQAPPFQQPTVRAPAPQEPTVRTPAAQAPPAQASPAHAPAGQNEAPAASVFAPKARPAAPAPEASLDALQQASASSATPASPDAVLIRRTMAEIEPVADKVTSYFYALLFVQHPDLRALFPASMDTQRDRLFKALLTAAQHVDDGEVLTAYLSNLGRGHRKYGTLPDHYPAVGECLLTSLGRYATSSWGPETEAAWVRAYTAISQIMIDAAAANEAVAPAWWQAEVVSHELRTPDIAVVTVRPDQPYPFLAGQYTSVETPWWPRVWRHYSFACAPRSDGLLSFHVKAVPAGWVSNAMVHRARPGDVIRLGAPGGSMTVDHTTRNGLLCVGGGTGIAPLKALVEDVAEHGIHRPVEVFYGARSDHDLYDLDTMLQLEQAHPWLSVRPVVATGPAARGGTSSETGQLPDAVRQYGPFREYDAYLSGPPGLIRSGVDALVGVGVPADRIRHDSVEELVPAGD
ncbi:flavohemoprotein [Streptomyces sioyaensis]|uniref:nitric oxide dioxygenase n=1 Tax=Streptomyces sioyaensis TaxID=67364 RepID=A0A4Q1R7M3_9ACTN|nr:globin domain-containing protein [Streptomyces sioyaensis]MBM4794682.1 flavohemoprotein [Streptomyces sioyaensis]RXS69320.1 flavohemoprotein [Streptomyces sioyaensis]